MQETMAATQPTISAKRCSYRVEQQWAGWWGGFGGNGTISGKLNELAADGWQLVDSRSHIRLWFWIIPRPKLLLFFEK